MDDRDTAPLLKPNLSGIRAEMEAAAAARARGEKFCWRCHRAQEYGEGPYCQAHAAEHGTVWNPHRTLAGRSQSAANRAANKAHYAAKWVQQVAQERQLAAEMLEKANRLIAEEEAQ